MKYILILNRIEFDAPIIFKHSTPSSFCLQVNLSNNFPSPCLFDKLLNNIMFQTSSAYKKRNNYSTPHQNIIAPNYKLGSFTQQKQQDSQLKNFRTNKIKIYRQTQSIKDHAERIKPSTTQIRKLQQGESEHSGNIKYQTVKQQSNKQFYLDWRQLNSNRLRFSNNITKENMETNYQHQKSDEAKVEDKCKIFRVQDKRPTIFQSHHKAANSVDVQSKLDSTINNEDLRPQNNRYRYIGGQSEKFKDKVNFSTNLISKQKIRPYMQKNRPNLLVQRNQGERKQTIFTHSAFEKSQNLQQLSEKVQILHLAPEVSHKTGQNFRQPEYFAESFKGRRPYNEDRYICEIKSNKLKQKMSKLMGVNQENNSGSKSEAHKNWFFGVFDGHGGSKCAQFLKQNFYSILSVNRNLYINPSLSLTETFNKLEQKFLQSCEKGFALETSGSCAVVSLIRQTKLYIGNVGDCRAVLLGPSNFKQITNDHKPDEPSQKSRIIRNGGKLYKDGSMMGAGGKQNIKIFNQTRILPGNLNVSRTIGDIEVKTKKFGGAPGVVIHLPEIHIQNLQSQFEHLILASDGLFEGLTNKQIHGIYQSVVKKQENFGRAFVKQIIGKSGESSNDNITVICIRLPKC